MRLLEIVGEAATRVSEETKRRYAAIPWAQVIGMRNRLIHGYDVVDQDVLWQTVTEDLPPLIERLEKRILVLRGGAIGDFVLTLPVFAALRERWPGAWIELVSYERIAGLALLSGHVDRVTSLDRAEVARLFSLRPALTPEQQAYIRSFDLVLSYLYDPGDTVRQNLLSAGARQVLVGSPQVRGCHAVPHLLKPLAELAIYARGDEQPMLRLPSDQLVQGRQRVGGVGHSVVALHPGSGSRVKNWPLASFLELAERISRETDLRPGLIAGEADVEIVRKPAVAGAGLPFLPGGSLVDLAATLSACRAYVGNDSGVTHLAAALRIPVVALFGPTDPAEWGPIGTHVRIIRSAEPTPEGLAAVTVDEVLTELLGLLRAARPPGLQ